MEIRPFAISDEAAVIALWQRCRLTRPWNDPRKDIARKPAVQPELCLVGEIGGAVPTAARSRSTSGSATRRTSRSRSASG
ncbi:MAG: hypothetical protein ACT4P3_12115 [Betaproteobacteria bacterium]